MTASSSSVSTSRLALAPESTTIAFSPSARTMIQAVPLRPEVRRTRAMSMPAAVASSSSTVAASSSPTAATKAVRAPARAEATAWLRPLPPARASWPSAITVSPGAGMRSRVAIRSRFALPTTTTS